MANLFRCSGVGAGGGSVDIAGIISEASVVNATGASTATNTVNFTAPNKGVLVVYYNRYKATTSYYNIGTFTVTQNGTSVTVATTTKEPTIIECAAGDKIVMSNTCKISSSTSGTSVTSGTKYAYLAYTFIPT